MPNTDTQPTNAPAREFVPTPIFKKTCPIDFTWAWKNRETNGLAASGAVVRYGRRLLVDPVRFNAWLASGATT